MTHDEKLEEIIKEVEETTDFSILSEMKLILNKAYKEENNQIMKPSVQSIRAEAKLCGIEDRLNKALEEPTSKIKQFVHSTLPQSLMYTIYIKFPEIEITNDNNNKHTITDLYVRLKCRPSGLLYGGIYGIRGSISKKELQGGYFHSHLTRFEPSYIIFNLFCTGYGEINQVTATLSTKFTTANFLMLTIAIKNFVVWESLEGRPYMYIKDLAISNASRGRITYYPSARQASVVEAIVNSMKLMEKDMIISMIRSTMTPTGIEITETEELEKFIVRKLDAMTRGQNEERKIEFLCTKSSAGTYIPIPLSGDSTLPRYQRTTLFTFKGEEIKLKITDANEEAIQETEKYPNPRLTKAVCEKLSHNFTEIAFNNSGIRTGSAIGGI